MFQQAIQKAQQYTFPFGSGFLLDNGEIVRHSGTYIILNKTGWCLSAYHVFKNSLEYAKGNLKEINSKKIILERVALNNIAFATKQSETKISPQLDLILFKIENIGDYEFEPPIFKTFTNPSTALGMSVCNYGFPLPEFKEEYTEDEFKNDMGVKYFPYVNSGIVSRVEIEAELYNRHAFTMSFPFIKGQSGGPVLDDNGHIVALTQRNKYFDLQLDTLLEQKKYLEVGQSITSNEITAVLRKVNLFKEEQLAPELVRFV